MDVGTTLRNARERSGLSIERVAASTRIPARLLSALENNAFDKVPSGIFTRGFIRAFAREVGLDPEETVAQYIEETGDTAPADEHVVEGQIDDDIRVLQVDPEPTTGRATWGYGLIIAALLVGIVSFARTGDAPVVTAEELPAPSGVERSAAAGEPGAVSTSGNGLLRFEVAPTGPCWVEAIADGKTAIYRLMQPGERETFSAREVALRVGDPSMFAYRINGRAGRQLGSAGVPASARVTSDSYQEFLTN
jgi:cytoskeleton protein RodZ